MAAPRAAKALVAIATTKGPVIVRSFEPDPASAKSAMVRFDQRHRPQGVDTHYAGFVREADRILSGSYHLPPLKSPVILEIEGEIDQGDSWQLGAFATQALWAAGRLAQQRSEAGRLLWLTGMIGLTEKSVRRVDHVPLKLDRSLGFFEDALRLGLAVTLVVPQDNAGEVDAAVLPAGVTVERVAKLDRLMALLAVGGTPGAAVPPSRRYGPVAAVLALLALAGAGWWWTRAQPAAGPPAGEQAARPALGPAPSPTPVPVPDPAPDSGSAPLAVTPVPNPPPAPVLFPPPPRPAMASPTLRLVARTPSDGSTCREREIHLAVEERRDGGLARIELSPAEAPRLRRILAAGGLCGLDIEVIPASGTRPYAALLVTGDGGTLAPVPPSLEGREPLAGPVPLSLAFDRRSPADRLAWIGLVAGETPIPSALLQALQQGGPPLDAPTSPDGFLRTLVSLKVDG